MKLDVMAQRKLPYRPVKVAHKVQYLYEYAMMWENEINSLGTCQEPLCYVF